MRAANKKVTWAFSALFLVLLVAPTSVHAQTFGGTSTSLLYSASNSSVFQAPSGTQQGGASSQGSGAGALQTTGVTVLAVTGAPAFVATGDDMNEMSDNSEVIMLSVFAGVFALGVLYLLSRQIKKSY
jgi:hypothetical protein